MKTSWKVKLVAAISAVTMLFCGCHIELSRTCISHIDRDTNGKCDNCGTKMTAVRYNVDKISIKTKPIKDYYAIGEKLDITGGVLSVTYNDGTEPAEFAFDSEGVTVKEPDMSIVGIKTVAVKYGGKQAFYDIEVGLAKYTVSFELGYDGGEQIQSQTVTVNEHAEKPENPQRDGYDFGGWFTDDKFEKEFDFGLTAIMKDTIIYAQWFRKFKVTYDMNFADGEDYVTDSVDGKIADYTPAEREGHKFAGWFYDQACDNQVDYDEQLTGDITVYAKWVSESAAFYTVTFDYNYSGCPESDVVEVENSGTVKRPRSPKRANVTDAGHQAQDFKFDGWYTDKDYKTAYNFKTPVTSNITLYAKWTGTYIFEAEYVSLTDENGLPLVGAGVSGNPSGTGMIIKTPADNKVGASGKGWVSYLYRPGLSISFVINSDSDVDDVKFVLRASCESKAYAIDPEKNEGATPSGTLYSKYTISLNGTPVNYKTVEFTAAQLRELESGERMPFSDFILIEGISLKKGMNTFTFITANEHGMGGTQPGTAPVIDCIKLTTSAELDWEPLLENLGGKEN